LLSQFLFWNLVSIFGLSLVLGLLLLQYLLQIVNYLIGLNEFSEFILRQSLLFEMLIEELFY
jgi:hypothetical protein